MAARRQLGCKLLLLALLIGSYKSTALPLAKSDDSWDAAGLEHVYQLSGSTPVPSYGTARLQLPAVLTEVDRDADGTRLMKLVVPEAPLLTDRNGLRHPLLAPYNVDKYDFYYRQAASGQLLDVLHDPAESWEALSMKRELISATQLTMALHR